ncbi:conserved hypothetical protein [Segniliparus rotundus DSM 44985]|uniref:DUF3828 domain-containing protein n=1 Tax=Segniliparus rotundus (strain ATCC BAA-972 / CDC 1076 / CIP 108378 / DSM 44985 / JCM 13578) TaxID=640132 RepID=D6ZEY4_SEGRD|nr:hypothetical protein [Segniliparus rotundus]ADG97508.1 conserved hypothetical protein [Segniliparus rotundus DSM 44985]
MPRILAATMLLFLTSLLTSCDRSVSQGRPDSHQETPSTAAVPQTLEAATAAAQEYADRRSANDLAGVWLLYDKEVRDVISQADYVRLNSTCRSSMQDLPLKAVGVRLDDSQHAVVRVGTMGIQVTFNMVYEDGKWLVAATDELRAEIKKPVDQIIADRRASGKCGDSATSQTGATPSSPPSTPTQ